MTTDNPTCAERRAATVYRLGKPVQPTPRPRAKPGKHSPAERLMQDQIAVLRALQAYHRWLDTSDVEGRADLSFAVVTSVRRYIVGLVGEHARLSQSLTEAARAHIDQDIGVLSEVAWQFANDADIDMHPTQRTWAEHAAWVQRHVVPLLRKHFRRAEFT